MTEIREKEIVFSKLKRRNVSAPAAQALRKVGVAAWYESLDRPKHEILRVFGGGREVNSGEGIMAYRKKLRKFARWGGKIVVAHEADKGIDSAIGFAMAKNDVSRLKFEGTESTSEKLKMRAKHIGKNMLKRTAFAATRSKYIARAIDKPLKKLNRPEKRVYAWVAMENVVPEYQNRGIGRGLFQAVLKPFRDTQIVSIYVFDENKQVLETSQRAGFTYDPIIQHPEANYDYFGEEADPVRLYRLTIPKAVLFSRSDSKSA